MATSLEERELRNENKFGVGRVTAPCINLFARGTTAQNLSCLESQPLDYWATYLICIHRT